MNRRRRRRLMMVFVLLLTALVGGAVVNVAVAWGCVIWCGRIGPKQIDRSPVTESEMRWLETYEPDLSGHHIAATRGSTFGHHACVAFLDRRVHASSPRAFWLIRCGWPVMCFQMQTAADEVAAEAITSAYSPLTGGLTVKQGTFRWNEEWRLPARPLPVGFAINTIFYAAILWGLFAVPGIIRRRWRVRCGLCAMCAYPVGTSEVCTECGGAVRVKSS